MSGKREYGDYQTPPILAKLVCEFLKDGLCINPSVIIEPTCGIGRFIKASLIFNANAIYGLEINPKYCLICTDTIDDPRVRIINCDIFSYNIRSLTGIQNTLVIGNPPWVTNSTLAISGSKNYPKKTNFRGLKGLDALTGASNFDICENIILKLIYAFYNSNTTIALLCKTSVARNVFNELNRSAISCNYCKLYDFDAKPYFDISVNACLFVIQLTNKKHMVPKICTTYDFEAPEKPKSSFGYRNGLFYSNLSDKYDEFDGKCYLEWRQGVKHDCSKIMELSIVNGSFINGNKEVIDIEEGIIYPLVKSSMFKRPIISEFTKFVIVTQKKSGDETENLQKEFPKAWEYLMNNRENFDKRKSAIYKTNLIFSMFGVGAYSYKKYKVGISGFYKEPFFSVLYSQDGKPVMLDDTAYFICFESFEEAYIAMLYLNSPRVNRFLKSITFRDAKRPYTKKILSRINFSKIIKVISTEELAETEAKLNLRNYITEKMVVNFLKQHEAQVRSLFANTFK